SALRGKPTPTQFATAKPAGLSFNWIFATIARCCACLTTAAGCRRPLRLAREWDCPSCTSAPPPSAAPCPSPTARSAVSSSPARSRWHPTDNRTAMKQKKKPARGRIRIAIVDDHPMMRQGLAQLINNEPDLTVCAEADTAGQALELLNKA